MSTTAVIGLGTMGAGIAAVIARAGHEVRAHDNRPEAMTRARADLEVIGGVLDRLEVANANGGGEVVFCDTLAEAVRDANLVLENIPEKLEAKQALFAELGALVSSECVLASDTSGIPITTLQAPVPDPERVIGMHWSNPPHIIPVIEVIAGEHTGAAVTRWMIDFVHNLGMLPVEVKRDVPGFVENRILYAIMREAVDLVEEGVIDARALDTCVSWGIGYKLAIVGPMALLDMAGLDIYESVSSYLNARLSARDDVSPFVTERTRQGHLGMKSGEGIYRYADGEVQRLRTERAQRFVAVRRVLEGRD